MGEWLAEAGADLDVCRPYAGDRLPDDLTAHSGMVVLGGEMGAHDDETFPWLTDVKRLVVASVGASSPVLGICLGHQLVAAALGGDVGPNPHGQQIGVLLGGFAQIAFGQALRHPEAQDVLEPGHRAPQDALADRPPPLQGRRLQDQARHALGMPSPHEQADGAAHGVAHHDGGTGAEVFEQGRGVIRGRLQAEVLLTADAPPVTPHVHGQHRAVTGQGGVEGEPVEVGAQRPAMQQEDGRRPGASCRGYLANQHLASLGHVDQAARRERRRQGGLGLGNLQRSEVAVPDH